MHTETIGLSTDVEALLIEAGLPTSDLATSRCLNLLGIRDGVRLAGIVGVEIFGSVGMLRSLVVDPNRRKSGFGGLLVSDAETLSARQGVSALYLLTTTAARFFERRGYVVVPRGEAPPAIAATAQFSSLCPTSSTFMCKILAATDSPKARRC